jgi:hypothetical protein
MALVDGNPQPGELYADVLFNTALLPAFVKGDDGNPVAKVAAASILQLSLGASANPTTPALMRDRINIIISRECYQDTTYNAAEGKGFDCLQNAYVGPSGPIVGQNIPSRYVIMGGKVTAGTIKNQADQLEVTAVGQSTFLQTDWRIPPNYIQSSPAV